VYNSSTAIDFVRAFSDYKMVLGRQSCRLKSETIQNIFVKDMTTNSELNAHLSTIDLEKVFIILRCANPVVCCNYKVREGLYNFEVCQPRCVL